MIGKIRLEVQSGVSLSLSSQVRRLHYTLHSLTLYPITPSSQKSRNEPKLLPLVWACVEALHIGIGSRCHQLGPIRQGYSFRGIGLLGSGVEG